MLIAATMLGNGGAFCWYSYVNPLMTEVSGFSVGTMPVLMLLAGASMCVGNYLGGHLSDRFTPGIVAMSMQFLMFASLLLIYFFASYGFLSALLMCVCTGCLFAVSSPQQLLLLQYSPGGEMMGGAMVQLAFNGECCGCLFRRIVDRTWGRAGKYGIDRFVFCPVRNCGVSGIQLYGV